MANKKYYYYVGVLVNDGITLVTKVSNADKTAFWNRDEKPMEFGSKSYAQDLVLGLTLNFTPAMMITSLVPINGQPCNQKTFDEEPKEDK